MGKKAISSETRKLLKERLGITKGENKTCKYCVFCNKQFLCSVHSLKVSSSDTCGKFKTHKSNGLKIYRGGGVSPR